MPWEVGSWSSARLVAYVRARSSAIVRQRDGATRATRHGGASYQLVYRATRTRVHGTETRRGARRHSTQPRAHVVVYVRARTGERAGGARPADTARQARSRSVSLSTPSCNCRPFPGIFSHAPPPPRGRGAMRFASPRPHHRSQPCLPFPDPRAHRVHRCSDCFACLLASSRARLSAPASTHT